MKKVLLGLVLFLVIALQGPAVFAQGCSVTGISLTSTGSSSSTCFVPAGQGISYSVTGSWVGSGSIQQSQNGGLSWVPVRTFTGNVAAALPPNGFHASYRVTFSLRTSGTMTGNLLGLNPVPGRSIFETVPIGQVAYTSFGTATTVVQYTNYIADVPVTRPMTVTTIGVLNAGTVGTDKVVYALYDGSGRLIGNTLATGTTTSGANAFQEIALVSNVSIPAGLFYIGVIANTGTDNIRLQATATFVNTQTTSNTGTALAPPTTITPPTTFTAAKGPIAYVKGF